MATKQNPSTENPETSPSRSRRAVLTAGLGALGAFAVSAIDRPAAVLAGSDGDVVLGTSNASGTTTKITVATASFSAVWGVASASSGTGVGIRGGAASQDGIGVWGVSEGTGVQGDGNQGSGVRGTSIVGAGVSGFSADSLGVYGTSNTGNGIHGESLSRTGVLGIGPARGVEGMGTLPGSIGVSGYSVADSSGVVGFSGPMGSTVPAAKAKTGVYGRATQDAASRGVNGVSTAGQGVRGEATTGVGVQAVATTGAALAVSGRAVFSRSGRASVPANAAYVDVTVPGALSTAATVLATLQTYRSGVWVAAVRTNYPSAGKIRIYLNKVASTSATTAVAWFVVG